VRRAPACVGVDRAARLRRAGAGGGAKRVERSNSALRRARRRSRVRARAHRECSHVRRLQVGTKKRSAQHACSHAAARTTNAKILSRTLKLNLPDKNSQMRPLAALRFARASPNRRNLCLYLVWLAPRNARRSVRAEHANRRKRVFTGLPPLQASIRRMIARVKRLTCFVARARSKNQAHAFVLERASRFPAAQKRPK
jgi:hypothetical protein